MLAGTTKRKWLPLWLQRKPSNTSSCEQREGEGGLSSANCAVSTGTFILLDFPLPWLLLIVLVSDKRWRALLKPGTYPCPRCRCQSSFHRHNCPAGTVPAAVTSVASVHHGDYYKTCLLPKGKAWLLRESLCTGLGAEAAGFWQSADYLQSGSPGVKNPDCSRVNLPGTVVQIVTIWPSQESVSATSLELLPCSKYRAIPILTVFLCSGGTHPWASQHGAACWHSALPAFSAPL